ncbi:MAG: ATP-binding cassette domain-containing protein [Geminicoccaceae bacterium]
MSSPSPLLSMKGIAKAFGGRPVLQAVDFDLFAGEVHALLGENGAGKSTLMNVLAGVYAADAGEIRLDGGPVAIRRPADAAALGIGMVHQHFRLVAGFTAAENLLLAAAGRNGIVTAADAARRLLELGARTGLEVRPDAVVGAVSIAERQRVEILKVLAIGARILVLDEPTAVLTDGEAETLLELVRSLARQGLAIVLISHKLREVTATADRVSVMRAGRMVVAGRPAAGMDAAALAQAMVGEAPPPPRRGGRTPGPVRLEVEDLRVVRADGVAAVDGVGLAVRSGEILGVAGVGGNGQSELAEALLGLLEPAGGRIRLEGSDITRAPVARRRDLGLRLVPADRGRLALLGELSVADNLALTGVRGGRFGRWLVDGRAMRANAESAIARFAVAGATPARAARLLSGGNAQKLVLARELGHGLEVLVAHSPTRGLDVQACAAIHAGLLDAAAAGAAILLISEDLEEVLALSDRIVVMSRGRIAGEVPQAGAREAIGSLMLGHA